MRTPEQVKWDYIQEWLKKAEQDLRVAMLLDKEEDKEDEIIGFHCQQSVEKFIKAVLVYRQIEFGKTHDIETLRLHLKSTDLEIAERLSIADWLTPMAVEYRYPEIYEEITEKQRSNAIVTAEEVKGVIMEFLDSYLKAGRP